MPRANAPATAIAPNVISVRHWGRLLGGTRLATSPRIQWPSLLRRRFDVDVLQCPACRGRIRVRADVTEPSVARRILRAIGLDDEPPPLARARDPGESWDGLDDQPATA